MNLIKCNDYFEQDQIKRFLKNKNDLSPKLSAP